MSECILAGALLLCGSGYLGGEWLQNGRVWVSAITVTAIVIPPCRQATESLWLCEGYYSLPEALHGSR